MIIIYVIMINDNHLALCNDYNLYNCIIVITNNKYIKIINVAEKLN